MIRVVGSIRSAVLQDDGFDRVGDVLAAVGRRLEVLEDVLPLDDEDGVQPALEKRGQRVLLDAVAFVLLGVHLDTGLQEGLGRRPLVERAQEGHRLLDDARRLDQHAREGDGVRHRLLDLVERHAGRRRVHEVQNVVQPAGQLVDILAVDRRDEGLVHPFDHLVRELVARVLDLLDLLRAVGEVAEIGHQLQELLGAPFDVLGGLLEEVEEDRLFRHEAEHAGD
jgi:hypothetical protein